MNENDALPKTIAVVRCDERSWQESVRRSTGERLGEVCFLSEMAGLSRLRIDHECLAPGRRASARHRHTDREEAFYVLSGELRLMVDDRAIDLRAGDFASLAPSASHFHTLVNAGASPVEFLAISNESPEDRVVFHPDEERGRANDPTDGASQ